MSKTGGSGRNLCIDPSASPSPNSGNPYRQVLRRSYPEPLIVVLAFILGLWIWDHYFGETTRYIPGTEEIALVKIDRDLRLADAMREDPAWLRWIAGTGTPEITRREAAEALEKLAEGESLSARGLTAYAVIRAVDSQKPVMSSVLEMTSGLELPDFLEMERRRTEGRAKWWELRMLESRVHPDAHDRAVVEETDAQRLRSRALIARLAVWLFALAGLAFLPSTVRKMAAGLKMKARGFGGGWTPAMGLTLFLVATLAWIGFGMLLDFGMKHVEEMPKGLLFGLDTTARLLPALIVLALIFRRPSHAMRVLGIDRKVDVGMILGLFSLLALLDPLLRLIFGPASPEPGGGLSPSGWGWSGLFVTLFTACLIAPFAEELLYRGILFRSFANRIGVAGGALVSSAIFALLHFYDGYGLASVGLFGFVAAVMYAATRSMTTLVLFHALYNLAIKLPEWIIYQF
ncbi:MAG: CPBP family intramembrane metalloprotease [Luteolibacter sp.]